jgi:hypothetical protein
MQLECTDRQTVHEGRTNAASNLPMTMPMMRCDVQLHKVALPPRGSATEYDAERASGNLCRARLGLQLHVLPQLSVGPTGVSVACAFASLYKVNLQLYRSGWRLPKLPLASASFSTCTKYTSSRRVESRMDYLGVAVLAAPTCARNARNARKPAQEAFSPAVHNLRRDMYVPPFAKRLASADGGWPRISGGRMAS